MSHDIRTPLALSLGYADEIARMTQGTDLAGASSNEKIQEKAKAIEEQSIRIRTLVMNLNTSNKLTYGMGSWKKEKLLLPALIRETVCDILNQRPDQKYDISVRITEESEQTYVKGDKELIQRVLANLVGNAMQHNPQGCAIHISLTLCARGRRFALSVSDNGCGVSAAQLRSFGRPIKANRLPEHGLGIRLVRQIASFHHWRVRFANKPEGGFCCAMTGLWLRHSV